MENLLGPTRPVTVLWAYVLRCASRLSQMNILWKSVSGILLVSISLQIKSQKLWKMLVVLPMARKHLIQAFGERIGSPGLIAKITVIFEPWWWCPSSLTRCTFTAQPPRAIAFFDNHPNLVNVNKLPSGLLKNTKRNRAVLKMPDAELHIRLLSLVGFSGSLLLGGVKLLKLLGDGLTGEELPPSLKINAVPFHQGWCLARRWYRWHDSKDLHQ